MESKLVAERRLPHMTDRGSSEAVHVLPPNSTTPLRQQKFARYPLKSSWGGLSSR